MNLWLIQKNIPKNTKGWLKLSSEYSNGFSVHDIAKLNVSGHTKFILVYAFSVPSSWIWRRKHIGNLLNVGERELRRVLRELAQLEVLYHDPIKEIGEDGKTKVKKMIKIDLRKLKIKSIDQVKENEIEQENEDSTENRSCTKRTCTNCDDIVINNISNQSITEETYIY